jgi:hypothetical protein
VISVSLWLPFSFLHPSSFRLHPCSWCLCGENSPSGRTFLVRFSNLSLFIDQEPHKIVSGDAAPYQGG